MEMITTKGDWATRLDPSAPKSLTQQERRRAEWERANLVRAYKRERDVVEKAGDKGRLALIDEQLRWVKNAADEELLK